MSDGAIQVFLDCPVLVSACQCLKGLVVAGALR
jgi:hypothetical protein